jgi:hypothetical protein
VKNPVTTTLSIVVAIGVLARAITLVMHGQAPDYTEVTMAVTTIAAAIGLYKAQDPPPADKK